MSTQEQPGTTPDPTQGADDRTQGFDWGAPSTAPPPPGPGLWGRTEDITSEQYLLASMILSGEMLERMAAEVDPADFARDAHRRLFAFLCECARLSRPFDMGLFATDLHKSGDLEAFGGLPYLMGLLDAVPSALNAPWYAGRVRAAGRKRRLAEGALRLLEGLERGDDLEASEAKAEQLIHAGPAPEDDHSRAAGAVLHELTERIEERAENPRALLGIPSGLRNVDAHLNGLQAPDLLVIGGRPGTGKSGLLTTVAAHVARRGDPVLLFSMEMSAEQVMMRMVCGDARVDQFRLRSGRLSSAEYDRYFAAVRPLHSAPLVINERSGVTPSYLRAQVRRFLRNYGRIALLGVDYVQLMRSDRPTSNRFQELTEVSIELKSIAREFAVPVIALAQLSRGVESRDNKRPVLSDLRETGQLEQDADIVGFLYREDMYARQGEAPAEGAQVKPAELLIRKHRNGPLGTVHLNFVDQFTLFMDGEGPA